VPTFYSHTSAETIPHSMLWALWIVGVFFGGIHCVAWHGDFPTFTELWLWRGAALAVTVLPCFALLTLYQWDTVNREMRSGSDILLGLFVLFSTFVVPLLYTAARMILLVQAFMQLRALPPSAYQTVRWTTFIPHI
jgi:hypothetical protein